ncbi:hypothetical protein [Hymenobacter sp. BRD67]|uniref:hypothetical protein n=1 Tax=Hymenobacter sp. BRD67 TaxID=2675877 RepID=UPI0015639E29|nr:hypothetical protein [Hymenobacter sp. BRD67]QKG51306.1 hypothetical protein GKZ67_00325 [Hymenobacter sp. BRD67]
MHQKIMRLLALFLAGLAACSSPALPTSPAESYLNCREVYEPVRGRLYDRHGTLLVTNEVQYTLSLPHGPPLDSVAFNTLMGWPAGALQARVAAARPPPAPCRRPRYPTRPGLCRRLLLPRPGPSAGRSS